MIGQIIRRERFFALFSAFSLIPPSCPRQPGRRFGFALATLAAFSSIALLPLASAADIFNVGFDAFTSGSRPAGWTFTDCDANTDSYTSAGNFGVASPSLKLDDTGDVVTSQNFTDPDQLFFWIKGVTTDATSHLMVEENYGATWYTFTDISDVPTSGTTFGPFTLNASSTTIRFS